MTQREEEKAQGATRELGQGGKGVGEVGEDDCEFLAAPS
jgi:hypothetical protein